MTQFDATCPSCSGQSIRCDQCKGAGSVTVTVATFQPRTWLAVRSDLPTQDRAEYLRGLVNEHLEHLDDHWKGRVFATVTPELADDMAEAMDFIGALVDRRQTTVSGLVHLYSDGYWHHGF
jgi:hypothetical protein